MRYPMKENTERPLFEYIVRANGRRNYYLYDRDDFDAALSKAIELSRRYVMGLIYEVDFDRKTGTYFTRNTFSVWNGKINYDKHAKRNLHVEFYMNAGQWMNPNEEWLKELSCNQQQD